MKGCLVPVVAFEAYIRSDEADGDVDGQQIVAGAGALEGCFGNGIDGISVAWVHRVDTAGPCPVG